MIYLRNENLAFHCVCGCVKESVLCNKSTFMLRINTIDHHNIIIYARACKSFNTLKT